MVNMHKRSVFIIGAGGMVGATAAQAIAIKEIVQDVVLIDVAEDLVRGQALDINHATAFTDGVHVRVGDYDEIREDDIVVVTCGVPLAQNPGKTRLELLEVNVKIIRDVVAKVMTQGKPVYIVMVANPVDVLTHIALQVSGLPKERVFGTGTTVDTARLSVTLANRLNVPQNQIKALVLGEHGDSSFPVLSDVTVSGLPLVQHPNFNENMTLTIEQDIRDVAYDIVKAKRSTNFGIGIVIAKVVQAMMSDIGGVFPVCSLAEGEYGLHDVVIGLPSLVSSRGVRILDHYPLTANEQAQLEKSADVVHGAMASVKVEN